MSTETKAVRDGAGGSRVAAANAEYRRWGTGGDSRRPPGERAWACRQNDNGSWQITTYHRNEREADEARHEQALAAATGAALAAPSAAEGGAIPEGWALLPLEATEAMWQAGRDADAHPTDSYSAVWDAMIAAAPSPSQGSDTEEAGRDPKGSDRSRAEPSGALHDAIAEIVQRAGDDPAQHFLRRTIARRNEERAAALKQTAAEPASSAVQGGAGDRTVLPRGAADISASPAPRHENGEAGETGTGSTECIGSVGRQAETPDYLTGFAPYTPVTVRSGTAAPPPTAPQGADLAGLREAHPNVARVLAIPALDIDVIRQSDGLLFGDLRALVSTASAPPAVADREATAEALWRSDNPAEDAAGWREWNAYVEKHGNAPALRREIDACRRRADAVLLALAYPGSVAPTPGERGGWSHDMAAAPAGEEVEIGAGRMTFLAKLVPNGSLTTEAEPCDQWQATREGEHPPCWSDGCCWASNEDESASLQPDRWRRVAPASQTEGERPPFRTGDSILHKPSGETWACAWADPETGYLSWLGWPPGEAKIADFELVKAATDEEHAHWLRDLKRSGRRDAAKALRLYGDPDASPPTATQDPDHG